MAATGAARGRVAVDPRLRARRVAVKRDEGRRRLRRLLWAVVALAAAGGLVAVTRTPLLDVDRISVAGSPNTPAEVVQEALGIRLGDPMTDLDLRAATARVESLPWVLRATVSRSWPNGVSVRIVERRPVAMVPGGAGRWLVLDGDARVLGETAVRSLPAALPAVLVNTVDAGQVPPGSVLGDIEAPVRAAAALTPDLAAWVEGVVPTDRGVDLALVGGATAHLGEQVDYAEELRSLATVLVRVDLTCLASVDVSAHADPVVTRRC
jgi:cell division protein FtsQ